MYIAEVPNSTHLHHPRHIPTTFRVQPEQQQVACFDGTGEVTDGHLATAVTASHVGAHPFLGVSQNACPKLGGLDLQQGARSQDRHSSTKREPSVIASVTREFDPALPAGFSFGPLWIEQPRSR